MTATTFTTVSDERVDADWPDSRHSIVTRVEGRLAEQVQARSGRAGVVTIHEHGEEGGYSEFTAEWDFDVEVKVDDETVWSDSGGYAEIYFDDFGKHWQAGALIRLIHWAEGGAA